MKPHAFVPSPLAPLEGRVGPTVGAAAASHAVVQVVHLNLHGIALGTENTVGPVHELLKTTASISPLGTVTVGGYLAYSNMRRSKRAGAWAHRTHQCQRNGDG